ncbi:hypothetical protein [Enhygromyxa salina]|uniref:Uncharacterized protein n=1 Tax=Enhygromyxa salina TaxID=215803 RepID=A0A2S9XT72_9BACT|nr:hypothetical protein [Enhygromyxa salina]PRP96067.1 hypothetical protein ENSA7_68810 [Enhygromyxa salina]
MYFTATIGIDPAQLTTIQRVKPSKLFGKLFYYLTAGLSGDRKEVETFTAVSILQQLNMVLRSVKITNIVRLAIDGTDLYLDSAGRPDDLNAAMKAIEVPALVSKGPDLSTFERIQLVLEHQLPTLDLLITAEINRVHDDGEFPILVQVQGLMREFSSRADEPFEALRERMRGVFEDQARYDQLLDTHESAFSNFVDELATALAAQIQVDKVETTIDRQLIRPAAQVKTRDRMRGKLAHEREGLYYGYYGFDDHFFYAWLWCDLSYEHDIQIRDVSLVDELGCTVLDVGEEGFAARSCETLNSTAAFVAPEGSEDITLHRHHDYAEALGLDASTHHASSDHDSWLFDLSTHDHHDVGASSCGTSCASSCASSCGGCGGFD